MRRSSPIKLSTGLIAALAVLAALGLTACRGDATAVPETSGGGEDVIESTSDPALAHTLQAETAATAAWVAEQAERPTATGEPVPTLAPVDVEGTPLAALTGACDVLDGYRLHVRDTFCIATPPSWKPLNVDGGLAASLQTTTGQAIGLQPGWAESADVCSLLIYTTRGESAREHLDASYAGFQNRADITELSPVQMQSLGELAMTGFTWSSSAGETGAIYADVVGLSRLVHVSFSGTQCSAEDLLPVLSTLRFNSGQ